MWINMHWTVQAASFLTCDLETDLIKFMIACVSKLQLYEQNLMRKLKAWLNL